MLNEKGELPPLDSAAAQMPPGDLGAAFAKMFLTFVALALLLFATYWFLRKFIQQRNQKGGVHAAIHILEKKMISPKTALYLIEVDKKRILIAESQLEIKRLESLESPPL